MNMFLIIYLYMYMIGLWTLCLNRKHLFICLLNLEFIILSMFPMMYYYLMNFNYEFYFGMIFLTLAVCEGAIGLSILVYLIRSHGNDYMKSMSMIMC